MFYLERVLILHYVKKKRKFQTILHPPRLICKDISTLLHKRKVITCCWLLQADLNLQTLVACYTPEVPEPPRWS